jgi:hypothetical protein|nr:MAG TPA: hypothetical protein [Caudoviricetes sp.]
MNPSEYFPARVETFLSMLPDRALETGVDVVTSIIVYDLAIPFAAKDYQCALEAWLQGRHKVWQSRIDAYKANPDGKNLATIARYAINEHTPHTQQDFDDIVERAYRLAIDETLIEHELEKRRNNNGER